jgi:hypothetical protein
MLPAWLLAPTMLPVAWKWRNSASMPPATGYWPATSLVHYTTSCNTQSSAHEDGRDQRPKHVKLIGIINKPLLLHLVGVYFIYINGARSNKYQAETLFSTLERSKKFVLMYWRVPFCFPFFRLWKKMCTLEQ